MPIPEKLDTSRIDLWHVLLDQAVELGVEEEYRALLAPEELQRERRLRVESVRVQFLVGRALVRTALSHYTGDDPRRWEFRPNAFGKPAVQSPPKVGLEFNLSHTRGLAVCAVTCGAAVGVDVEDCQRVVNHAGLARRYFAPSEAAALQSLAPEQQRGAFFEFWTLKEAFLKARGVGLSMPLDSFAFSLAADQPPRIALAASAAGLPQEWQFGQLLIASRYQVAVAAHMPSAVEVQFVGRQTVPLRWQGPPCPLAPSAAHRWIL